MSRDREQDHYQKLAIIKWDIVGRVGMGEKKKETKKTHKPEQIVTWTKGAVILEAPTLLGRPETPPALR